MQGEQRRYAVVVPLQGALGPSGIAAFARKHAEVIADVRRALRERGVGALQTFLFQAIASRNVHVTFT